MNIAAKIFIFFLLAGIAGCNKEDDFNYPKDTVGNSRITYFPILTVKGEAYVPVAMGSTFTDPGVTATEAGAPITVTTSGTVNTSVPGVYTLNYSAVNKDGFPSTGSRTVVVYSTDATATANDFSGNYARNTNGSISTWTKIAPGVYTVFNPGGAPGTNVTVIVINPTGLTIDMPSQRIGDGSLMSSITETYMNTSPARYSWAIVNAGYGPALRTFIKQ